MSDSPKDLAERLTDNERRILRALGAGHGLREVEIDRLVSRGFADRDLVSGMPVLTALGREVLQFTSTGTAKSERRSRWDFASAGGAWKWSVTRPDGTVAASPQSFKTRQHCADDAARNGYVPWPASQERRRVQPGAA